MKRLIAYMLMLALLIAPISGLGESYNYILLNNSDAGNILDVCPWEDGLLLLGSTGVWYHQPKTGEMTALLNYSRDLMMNPVPVNRNNLTRIFTQNDKVYVFDPYTPAFYQVVDYTAIPCLESAADIYSYEDQGETLRKSYVSSVVVNDRLYLLLNSFTFDAGSINELYCLNAETDEITYLGQYDIDTLYSAAEGKLLAGKASADGQGTRIFLIDPVQKTMIALNERLYRDDAVGFALDSAADTLYYAADNGKVFVEKAGQQAKILAYLPFNYLWPSTNVFLWNNSYVYLQSSTLNIRQLDGNPDELITLRILGSVSDNILQQYMAENPNVSIVIDPRESSFLGLQEALVSGDDSIDMFLVTTDGIYTEVVEKGYAAPLSGSAYLKNRVDQFYPWAQDILRQNGTLYAIPVSFTSDYWTINRTKWNELGLGSYPQTYEELFTVASTWTEEYAEDYPDYYVFECPDEMPGMIRTMIRQYLLEHEDWTAPVNFNTPEFRAAMQSVMDHPDVFTYDGERMALIMCYPQYLGTGYNDEDLVESFLPPALSADSDQVVGGRMELLVMNPSSSQKEEVLRFMEFYMAHLDPQITYSLDASCTDPLRPNNYESNMANLSAEIQGIEAQIDATTDPTARAELVEKLEVLQRRYARLESNWRFSAEDIEIYQGIADKTVISTKTIYPAGGGSNTESIDTVIAQFAAGSMSLDQFIRTLNERAKIMFLEVD